MLDSQAAGLPKVAALIVAAGRGSRAGGDVPKQYRALHGRPVLRHALEAFANEPRVHLIQPVIGEDDNDLFRVSASDIRTLSPVHGGATRQASVLAGLRALRTHAPDIVLIHDGGRPLIDPALIVRVLDAVRRDGGAIPALPVDETLKRVANDAVRETVPRNDLVRVQTPQGFAFEAILAAHETFAGLDLTDDAAVAERAGLNVAIVAGDADNLKITHAGDFERAERILASRLGDVRIGQGFDVHRFGPGDHVWLCGVKVPHDRGLVGHSDADVGLHSLTDAILGAIARGDIGDHFPPSDERWRGAPSHIFLEHAGALVREARGVISHCDVTLICERPKVAPHRAAMIVRIADILRIDAGRVSVKATTTEGLGFTGRSEGIAAQAVATVRLPI